MTELLKNAGRSLLKALDGYEPEVLKSASGAVPASVLMPLMEKGGQVVVLFTKRTSQLPTHAGQISFPGGASEEQDRDSQATALRETEEEVGIERDKVEVITRLDQVVTVTNFLVTPYLGLVSPDASLEPNPVEVERLIEVPAERVFNPERYELTDIDWQGISFRQKALSFNGDLIWGATARILLNLLGALGPRCSDLVFRPQ